MTEVSSKAAYEPEVDQAHNPLKARLRGTLRWRATAELVALYALIMLFVHDWHHGVIALIAVAATSEACRG